MLKKFTRPMRNLKYRDDEVSIAEAIRCSWIPGFVLYDSMDDYKEGCGAAELQENPDDDHADVVKVHIDFIDFLSGRRFGTSYPVLLTACVSSWSVDRLSIVKRSGRIERESPVKSRPRVGQVMGFCQRPGIDKPP